VSAQKLHKRVKKSLVVVLILFTVLALDQALKIWVKTHFCYGEERPILGLAWARLNFVENPGMAFGWKFGGEYGKLALSLFRIAAIGFLIYYIARLVKSNVGYGILASFAFILAGAIGNIIDSALYGMIFSESDYHCANGAAQLFPEGGGYGKFLHGKVVDMLFFPLWHNELGEVLFFQPVFNIADSSITIGVLSILLFQRKYFNGEADEPTPVTNVVSQTEELVDDEGNNASDLLNSNVVAATATAERIENVGNITKNSEITEGGVEEKNNGV
jgi:signal peptidase II